MYTRVIKGDRESWKKFGNGVAVPPQRRELVIDMKKVEQLRKDANEIFRLVYGRENPIG